MSIFLGILYKFEVEIFCSKYLAVQHICVHWKSFPPSKIETRNKIPFVFECYKGHVGVLVVEKKTNTPNVNFIEIYMGWYFIAGEYLFY